LRGVEQAGVLLKFSSRCGPFAAFSTKDALQTTKLKKANFNRLVAVGSKTT
jgi:hypothetical protein